MLERVSWSTYWTVIVIVALVYYAFLFILFYKNRLLFRKKVKDTNSIDFRGPAETHQPNLFGFEGVANERSEDRPDQQFAADSNILMPLVHDLIQELKEFIVGIAERSYIKEEVIMGIQVIIRNYKKLEASPYQKSINDFIKSECEDHCSIHLSEEDIRRIWIG